jgi:hypothetical protein
MRRHGVLAVLARDLDPRPFLPEVDPGCGLNRVDDEGAPDAGGRFQEDVGVGPRPAADERGFRTQGGATRLAQSVTA